MTRLPYTPRSIIKHALRQLWLRSRERLRVLKESGYTCQQCGVKQSKAKGREVKVEAHHVDGHDMDHLVDTIHNSKLLNGRQQVLCKKCHEKISGSKKVAGIKMTAFQMETLNGFQNCKCELHPKDRKKRGEE